MSRCIGQALLLSSLYPYGYNRFLPSPTQLEHKPAITNSFAAVRIQNRRSAPTTISQHRNGSGRHLLYSIPPKPYVPDGLTPDEYLQIKRREQEKQSKMDFASFGPRFRKDERPKGDWFLMRSLWTTGFEPNAAAAANSSQSPLVTMIAFLSRIRSTVCQYGPWVVLSRLLVLDIVLLAAAMIPTRGSGLATNMLPPRVFSVSKAILLRPLRVAQSNNINNKNSRLLELSSSEFDWKVQLIKLTMATFLSVPLHKFVGYANHRWKWSEKWTFLIGLVMAIGYQVMCGYLLCSL